MTDKKREARQLRVKMLLLDYLPYYFLSLCNIVRGQAQTWGDTEQQEKAGDNKMYAAFLHGDSFLLNRSSGGMGEEKEQGTLDLGLVLLCQS